MRLLVLLPVLLAAAGPPALGTTFVVTKEADDAGPCTIDDCGLREALLAANALPGVDRIEVPPGTYQLSLVGAPEEGASLTGDLDVLDDVEIVGDASVLPTIVGDGTDRVIHSESSHTLTLENLVVTGGVAQSAGGGIRIGAGNLTLRNSIVIGNHTTTSGGGIFLGPGTSLIVDSTITENTADIDGGGVRVTTLNSFHFVDFSNVTLSANHARVGGGTYLFGSGFISLTNTTIADNTGELPFSAALVGDTANRITFRNILVANNECGYIASIPMSNGHNMEGPTATCFLLADGDAMGVPDIMLGPLEDNGGPTPTHGLLAGSPAIDAALDADCPVTDQRGVPRPTDGDADGIAACDIGAFEAQGAGAVAIPAVGPSMHVVFAVLLAFSAAAALRRRVTT